MYAFLSICFSFGLNHGALQNVRTLTRYRFLPVVPTPPTPHHPGTHNKTRCAPRYHTTFPFRVCGPRTARCRGSRAVTPSAGGAHEHCTGAGCQDYRPFYLRCDTRHDHHRFAARVPSSHPRCLVPSPTFKKAEGGLTPEGKIPHLPTTTEKTGRLLLDLKPPALAWTTFCFRYRTLGETLLRIYIRRLPTGWISGHHGRCARRNGGRLRRRRLVWLTRRMDTSPRAACVCSYGIHRYNIWDSPAPLCKTFVSRAPFQSRTPYHHFLDRQRNA